MLINQNLNYLTFVIKLRKVCTLTLVFNISVTKY